MDLMIDDRFYENCSLVYFSFYYCYLLTVLCFYQVNCKKTKKVVWFSNGKDGTRDKDGDKVVGDGNNIFYRDTLFSVTSFVYHW